MNSFVAFIASLALACTLLGQIGTEPSYSRDWHYNNQYQDAYNGANKSVTFGRREYGDRYLIKSNRGLFIFKNFFELIT